MQEIHLIAQYFITKKLPHRKESDPIRQSEIDAALQHNLDNPLITQIHLLTEENYDFTKFAKSQKIKQTVIGQRMTYQDAVDYANMLSGKLCIISNSDMYFDETLQLLLALDMNNKMFALMRWDFTANGSSKIINPKRGDTQDSWIFLSPLPKLNCPFTLGVPGCENSFAQVVHQAGIKVYNPCFEIKSYHLHSQYVRNYLPRVTGAYYHPKPCYLRDIG